MDELTIIIGICLIILIGVLTASDNVSISEFELNKLQTLSISSCSNFGGLQSLSIRKFGLNDPIFTSICQDRTKHQLEVQK